MKTNLTGAVAPVDAVFECAAAAPLGNAAIAKLEMTHAQLSQQVDLADRLLHMAVSGTPVVDGAATSGLGIDLALHALLTAYMALADGYELHTLRAAHMLTAAYSGLVQAHTMRAHRVPAQVQ